MMKPTCSCSWAPPRKNAEFLRPVIHSLAMLRQEASTYFKLLWSLASYRKSLLWKLVSRSDGVFRVRMLFQASAFQNGWSRPQRDCSKQECTQLYMRRDLKYTPIFWVMLNNISTSLENLLCKWILWEMLFIEAKNLELPLKFVNIG